MNTIKIKLIFIACFFSFSQVSAQKYWIYDAERQFTDDELYMMYDCGSCNESKHFKAISNPPGIPVLSDKYAKNKQCAEMYFPGCHFSMKENFCMKTMAQPEGQVQFPYGTDIFQAFSVFVPVDYDHDPASNLIYQFHGYPDDLGTCDYWRSPPFSIAFMVDKWRVFGRYAKQKCNPDGNGSVTTMVLNDSQPIVKGDWTHFVIHLRYDFEGEGRCEVWLRDAENDKPLKIVDYTGAIGFNDERPPYDYVSFGYYYSKDPGPDITLYFDRIIFGGSKESLESLMYME